MVNKILIHKTFIALLVFSSVSVFSWVLWLDSPLSGEIEKQKNFISFFEPNSSDERRFLRANIHSEKYITVGVHGIYGGYGNDVEYVNLYGLPKNKSLSVEKFSTLLKSVIKTRQLDGQLPIFLASCGTGDSKLSPAFAQKLSDRMGVIVKAPVEYLSVDYTGAAWTSSGYIENFFMQIGLVAKRYNYKIFNPSNT